MARKHPRSGPTTRDTANIVASRPPASVAGTVEPASVAAVELESLLGALADADEPRYVVSLDGTIVLWNTAAADLFKIPAWYAIGRPCRSVIAASTLDGGVLCRPDCEIIQAATEGRSAHSTELLAKVGRGPRPPTHLRVLHVALKGPSGKPRGVLHLVENAEARMQREDVGARYLALVQDHPETEAAGGVLTPRERDVLRLLARGLTSREIAERLSVSHATARTHAQRILSKLGAPNRMAALARVLEADSAH